MDFHITEGDTDFTSVGPEIFHTIYCEKSSQRDKIITFLEGVLETPYSVVSLYFYIISTLTQDSSLLAHLVTKCMEVFPHNK